MIKTISISAFIQAQGKFVRACRNGETIIKAGDKTYRGWPVAGAAQ